MVTPQNYTFGVSISVSAYPKSQKIHNIFNAIEAQASASASAWW